MLILAHAETFPCQGSTLAPCRAVLQGDWEPKSKVRNAPRTVFNLVQRIGVEANEVRLGEAGALG